MQIYNRSLEDVLSDDTLRRKFFESEYEKLIKLLVKKGRVIKPFNKLKISDYYDNRRVNRFGYLYQRHHINEIYISGAFYKELPSYKTDNAILVDYIEHFLLHYLIILAKTTTPNYGILTPLLRSGLSLDESLDFFYELVRDNYERYNLVFIKDFRKYITGLWEK